MSQEEQIITRDGKVTVTILDESEVSIDRIGAYLYKNAAAAKMAIRTDNTPLIPKTIKDLLILEVEKS